MSRKIEVPRCPWCREYATHVIVNETEREVAFVRCDPCQLAAYRLTVLDANGSAWKWDTASVWAFRDQADRVVKVLYKARQERTGEKRDVARAHINAQLTSWLLRDDLGPWTSWSEHDCKVILARANPLIRSYADALVTGADRVVLHASASRTSAFPRVHMALLLLRDRVREGFAKFVHRFGRVATSDER